jgi:hypothetical protein
MKKPNPVPRCSYRNDGCTDLSEGYISDYDYAKRQPIKRFCCLICMQKNNGQFVPFYTERVEPNLETPDFLVNERWHFVCPKCIADNYRDNRPELVVCYKCRAAWMPDLYAEGNPCHGILEKEPHPERYVNLRCEPHGRKNCQECLKKELYAE